MQLLIKVRTMTTYCSLPRMGSSRSRFRKEQIMGRHDDRLKDPEAEDGIPSRHNNRCPEYRNYTQSQQRKLERVQTNNLAISQSQLLFTAYK
jgi:hypothetical protein